MTLREALSRRILVLDGAMGTMIQAQSLGPDDFGGAEYEGCNEYLNLTRPDVVRAIHTAYLDAGADLVSTNTFGCAPYVLAEYGLADRVHEITLAAARIARGAADDRRGAADEDRGLVGDLGGVERVVSLGKGEPGLKGQPSHGFRLLGHERPLLRRGRSAGHRGTGHVLAHTAVTANAKELLLRRCHFAAFPALRWTTSPA